MERLGRGIDSFINSPVSLVQEMIRIFPDGIIMGMGFFAIITLSLPYGIFFGSLVESLLPFYALRTANSYLNFVTPNKGTPNTQCVSGFMSNDIESLTMFGSSMKSAFPSSHLYIISVASSYVMSILFRFSKELEIMGSNYSSRFYIASLSLPILITFIALFRIYFGCDDFSIIFFSIIAGLVVGALLVEQNRRLFGLSSINIIGIPVLYKRTADGEKLYICPTPTSGMTTT
jgi:hypothetical protein